MAMGSNPATNAVAGGVCENVGVCIPWHLCGGDPHTSAALLFTAIRTARWPHRFSSPCRGRGIFAGTCTVYLAFMWVLGTQTRTFVLAQQAPLPA